MISDLFSFLADVFSRCFNALLSFLQSCLIWILDFFTWAIHKIAELWIDTWSLIVSFILDAIPNVSFSDYQSTIVQIRVYWAQWDTIFPLSTFLNCTLLFLTNFMLVCLFRVVRYLVDKICDMIP